MKTTEEIIKEFKVEFKDYKNGIQHEGDYVSVEWVAEWINLRLQAKDQLWIDKIRSLIPKIHGGGNARRLLESLLDNKTE